MFLGQTPDLKISYTGTETSPLKVLYSSDGGNTYNPLATAPAEYEIISACYVTGTLIRTVRGEVAVEALSIGDVVITASGEYRPIKWIGHRAYAGRFANANPDVLPICFKAGSLANDVPRRDLWISPHHAMYLQGVLIEVDHHLPLPAAIGCGNG